jgi:hypothetical protein
VGPATMEIMMKSSAAYTQSCASLSIDFLVVFSMFPFFDKKLRYVISLVNQFQFH